VAVAGYLAYDAFRDEHAANDAATEEIEAGASGGSGAPGDEPGALTPIGEQAEVIAGMDTLDDVATGSAGALLGAVDDARAAVDDLNGVQPDAAPAAPDAAAPAALPGTIDAAILRYDLGSVSDPVVHHVVAHLASDTYLIATVAGGTLRDVAETGTADVARYDAEGGIATRTARSAASREGGPDALFVSAVSPGVLLPPAAEPFARPTSIGVTDTSGRPLAAEAYVVDVEAFRAADPETAAAWLTVLALADPMSTLEEGLPNLDANLLAVRREVDAMVARVDAGAVAGSPPIATSGQVVVGWTAAAGEPYVRSAYAASGDRTFQWLYRVTAVDQPAVTVFAVR
ncbi:MAG: hypothetical protein CL424_16120, partial [Acidimicrobiaceae bacterium]|nr:hypothetical protein [Acidimicrobiaceae bacterium]